MMHVITELHYSVINRGERERMRQGRNNPNGNSNLQQNILVATVRLSPPTHLTYSDRNTLSSPN